MSLTEIVHYKLVPASEDTLKLAFPTIISELYRRTREQGLERMLFPGDEDLNYWKFTQTVARPGNYLVLGWATNVEGIASVAGFGWLYDYHGKMPEAMGVCGYCFFREWWGTEEIINIARDVVDYWFKSGFRAIYGTMLTTNRLAQSFDKKIGFKEVATLPNYFYRDGKLHSGVMYCKEREG